MIALAVGVALVAVAAAISVRRGLGVERELAVAVLRGVVQLGAVTLVIQAIFDHLGLSAAFAAVMVVAAAFTAGRRIRPLPAAVPVAGVAIAAAAALCLLPLFAAGAFPLSPQYVIPVAGIVIGGAMKATSVAGMRLLDDLGDHRAEVEARLALGDSAREALRPSTRRAAITALVPAIDQTRNVGLVTLPGAFVGMLLGGASPVEAAQVQLTVLFALLGAEALAATFITMLVTRAVIRPGERIDPPARTAG